MSVNYRVVSKKDVIVKIHTETRADVSIVVQVYLSDMIAYGAAYGMQIAGVFEIRV